MQRLDQAPVSANLDRADQRPHSARRGRHTEESEFVRADGDSLPDVEPHVAFDLYPLTSVTPTMKTPTPKCASSMP